MSGAVSLHQEFDAVVTEIAPWGVLVDLEGRASGLVDNTKLPAWLDDTPLPEVGSTVRVVVLDDARDPVRVSALASDLEIARRLR
ncbi:S1 RNA-binding domain-containing protein [Streptomyces hainanensis]|uniref:S1 RNA-binding domain-containing protein n=1 Tax=Streptomyces hainanensis TaxID=402648 RepID=A0A4R4TA97_9ACTN|nr:S1 RNA-binding domain-containing protein [Streptomyces hainanensis]TDC74278.1 S1 RNA-binding domain-containing protein [Streptomyces hainanensis]